MAQTESLTIPFALERECDCPPWVKCKHFDGRVVWLLDNAVAASSLGHNHRGNHAPTSGYTVLSGREREVHPCRFGGEPVLGDVSGSPDTDYDNLDTAKAEFDRREAELLRHD